MHTDHRNMPRGTLAVAPLSEEAKCGRHVFLHPLPVRVRVAEGRDSAHFQGSVAITTRDGLEFGIVCGGRYLVILADED